MQVSDALLTTGDDLFHQGLHMHAFLLVVTIEQGQAQQQDGQLVAALAQRYRQRMGTPLTSPHTTGNRR